MGGGLCRRSLHLALPHFRVQCFAIRVWAQLTGIFHLFPCFAAAFDAQFNED